MVRYKAIIAYDGTNFNGFQKQPNVRGCEKAALHQVIRTAKQK
jgi:tRNA pseudouridine38-40 synthase